MIILYIIGIFILLVLAYVLLNLVASLIGYCVIAFVLGAITWWLFDSFWIGFIIGLLITIWLFFSGSDEGSSAPYVSSGGSNSSYSSSRHISNNSEREDNRREAEDEERNNSKRERYEYYMREAEDAYSEYEYYKSKAEEARSNGDIYMRSANDHEYYARELDDDMHSREAREDRETARGYYDDAERYMSKANEYYDKYQRYKSDADYYR